MQRLQSNDARFMTVHNRVFCTVKLCMNYITQMARLVSFSDRNEKLLRFV